MAPKSWEPQETKTWGRDALQQAQRAREDQLVLNYQIPKPRFNDNSQEMNEDEIKQYIDDYIKRVNQEALTEVNDQRKLSLTPNSIKTIVSTQGGMVSVQVIVDGVPYNQRDRVNQIFDEAYDTAREKYEDQQNAVDDRKKSTNEKTDERERLSSQNTNQSPTTSQTPNNQENRTAPSPFGQLGKTPQLKPPGSQNT